MSGPIGTDRFRSPSREDIERAQHWLEAGQAGPPSLSVLLKVLQRDVAQLQDAERNARAWRAHLDRQLMLITMKLTEKGIIGEGP